MNDDIIYLSSAIVDPDKYEKLFCKVCDAEMIVQRGLASSHSYAGAVCGTNRIHDNFDCPDKNRLWHYQAERLIRDAKNSPSKILENLLLDEAKGIISTKTFTKDHWR